MNYCATCKHWLHLEAIDPANAQRWGTCERVESPGAQDGSDRFYVADASSYAAWLGTRDDFGCVEHEERGE